MQQKNKEQKVLLLLIFLDDFPGRVKPRREKKSRIYAQLNIITYDG